MTISVYNENILQKKGNFVAMKFRTPINIKPFTQRIDYSHKILALGSCFADAVGGRLKRAKFCIEVNPTGVLFNPASISMALRRFIDKTYVDVSELREGAQGWFHYDFHSSLSGDTPQEALDNINNAIEVGHKAVRSADWIIVTLGTSWIYRLVESGEVVASCHKQPSVKFVRERMSVDQVVEILEGVLRELIDTKNIILTLSPIRHVADGLAENSLSKATLRVAIDELTMRYPERINYFPSYEIFIDDLRDYRFYGEDMVHPSKVGVDYVWDKFREGVVSEGCNLLIDKVINIVRATEHIPYNPKSTAHKQFCVSQLRAISTLDKWVNMDDERQYFEKGVEEIV